MPSSKEQEMLDTLKNELHARVKDWTFDERKIVNVYQDGQSLVVEFDDVSEMHILVRDHKLGNYRRCPRCGEQKPGWPNEWRNVEASPRTQYACGMCAYSLGFKERA